MDNLIIQCHNNHEVDVDYETEHYLGGICKECKLLHITIQKKQCNHEEKHILLEYKNGAFNLRKICIKCLEFTEQNIKIDNKNKYQIRKLTYINDLQDERNEKLKQEYEKIRLHYNKERNDLYEQRKIEKDSDFWERYNAHLQTEKWRLLRLQVLQRDNYLCQGCRIVKAHEVHHLTYRNLGDEFLFQLISLCKPCHDKFHER
jgi:hypothetical protein